MAPIEPEVNYYAVLEVSKDANAETVKRSYRRLARTCHPDRKEGSTVLFQLLQNAYETISDPAKRREYDFVWRKRGFDKNQADPKDAERKKGAEQKENAARAAREKEAKDKENAARKERLRVWQTYRFRYESDIFEVNRTVRRLVVDLKQLQAQDDEDVRKERVRNSWWTTLTSPIVGQLKETEDEKQIREMKHLQRVASKRVKEAEMQTKTARLEVLRNALQSVEGKIAAEKEKAEEEARADMKKAELKRQEEERLRVEQERREWWARTQRMQAERAEREARAAAAQMEREAREAREAAESRETEQRAQKAAETARKARVEKTRGFPAPPTKSTGPCMHDQWWRKVQGAHTCSNCFMVQKNSHFNVLVAEGWLALTAGEFWQEREKTSLRVAPVDILVSIDRMPVQLSKAMIGIDVVGSTVTGAESSTLESRILID